MINQESEHEDSCTGHTTDDVLLPFCALMIALIGESTTKHINSLYFKAILVQTCVFLY